MPIFLSDVILSLITVGLLVYIVIASAPDTGAP